MEPVFQKIWKNDFNYFDNIEQKSIELSLEGINDFLQVYGLQIKFSISPGTLEGIKKYIRIVSILVQYCNTKFPQYNALLKYFIQYCKDIFIRMSKLYGSVRN